MTELEYIHKNKGSIEPTDVPSPEVAVESKEEQLTQEVAVESRDEQLALEVAVESRSERLIEDQPDALEEGKGEAIYMQLTEQESIHKSPSEELKSEDIKSEDEETASLNSGQLLTCWYAWGGFLMIKCVFTSTQIVNMGKSFPWQSLPNMLKAFMLTETNSSKWNTR